MKFYKEGGYGARYGTIFEKRNKYLCNMPEIYGDKKGTFITCSTKLAIDLIEQLCYYRNEHKVLSG